MSGLEIFGRHTSYNVQKVLWLADELQLDYQHIQVGGRYGGNDSAEFLSINPLGKVPVLRHGSRTIWESNTIVRYLADTFSKNTWIASNAYERSEQERWMDWSIAKLEPAFVGVFWGFYRTPPAQRNINAIEKSVDECNSCLSLLGDQLQDNSHLLGGSPTVADISVAVFLHRLWSIELEIEFPANIEQWYQRLSIRPSYTRWVMSDFKELQGRSDY